ncbi:amino acid permease [Kineococcus sp. T13]|nr:APC family permease [Kineococcus vitellinus]NAZ77746.1 amino acid permease [Kineococcus vitellinus]
MGVTFFVVAAVAPMAAVVGGSPVVFASIGAATPAVFLLAGALFAVFSVGYVTMSRRISNAGGFVTYVASGLGTRAGAAAAGVTVLFYIAVQCALWSQYGVFVTQLFAERFGLPVPRVVLLLASLLLVTALTARGVDVSLKVLGALLLLEVATFVVLDVGILLQGGGPSGGSLAGFTPDAVLAPGLGVAFLFCVSCFTGFEATVVFSEEAREPRRTIPRAAYLSIGFVGLFYAFTTWCLSTANGLETVQADAGEKLASGTFVPDIAARYLGPGFATVLDFLVVTSFLAMLIGFHNLFARYVFALGRAGAIPAVLGRTSARTRTPVPAALAIGATELVVLGGFEIARADPIATTYFWLLALGTASLLVVLLTTCIAMLLFLSRSRVEEGVWRTTIAPALSAVGFVVVLYLAITNYALLGGAGAGAWLLLGIPLLAVLGWWRASVRRDLSFSTDLS